MILATIDGSSPVPPFEQLRAQVAAAIRAGGLSTGTQLPTVRQLAGDLGIAPNTVARAYRALEGEGLVTAAGRRGTIVADPAVLGPARRAELVARAAERYLAEARRLGAEVDDAMSVVRRVAGRHTT